MKKLISTASFSEIGLLKSMLEAEGVACTIRNEHISMAAGTVPYFDCWPELWILHDTDFAKAEGLLASWQAGSGAEMSPWRCPGCAEELEGQFTSCWKCGYERELPAPE